MCKISARIVMLLKISCCNHAIPDHIHILLIEVESRCDLGKGIIFLIISH